MNSGCSEKVRISAQLTDGEHESTSSALDLMGFSGNFSIPRKTAGLCLYCSRLYDQNRFPYLAYRWGNTEAGTNAETSPPMLEISRINREETNV